MEVLDMRSWVIFYLISFVVILWAAFLTEQGVMLWVSLTLVIVVGGVNFVTICNEVKHHASHKAMQSSLTQHIEHIG
jgi:fatty acid desaturase